MLWVCVVAGWAVVNYLMGRTVLPTGICDLQGKFSGFQEEIVGTVLNNCFLIENTFSAPVIEFKCLKE